MRVWSVYRCISCDACFSYVHIGDQSAILREGYWASYNIPFYEDVFNISGYPGMVERFGPSMSHDLAPRAKIFRRDQGKVCVFCDKCSPLRTPGKRDIARTHTHHTGTPDTHTHTHTH